MCAGIGAVSTLVVAQAGHINDALNGASAVERLGIVGILTLCLIISVGANIYLVFHGIKRLVELIERGVMAADKVCAAIDRLERHK